ncbi:uncharacterized protein BDZ99DRAFT_520595 [Mytilinidion resinicola]|uniref:Rho-GAP domain-containing protein n=1 Tax=Mytilinidion resinicola TaxID=574789 RepID=A0A6A6YP21_9PEZI|nr:uncharacterized protein BDZ99DRAFT_520595 [Mytilinidion resinicola]KAF2810530.1 hypothetical protein BDZ99DRAFT_520595 [Mytilinidion resinicola]
MSTQSPRVARSFDRYWLDDCPLHLQPSVVFSAARPPPRRSGYFLGNTFALYGRPPPLLNTRSQTFDTWERPQRTIRKMPKSSSLSITTLPARTNKHKEGKLAQALSPRSPQSPPLSGSRYDADALNSDALHEPDQSTPIAPFRPPDSPTSPRHRKETSRTFFANIKASKSSPRITSSSSPRLGTADGSLRQVTDSKSSASQVYPSGHTQSSSPELSSRSQDSSSQRNGASSAADGSDDRSNSGSIKSTSVPYLNGEMAFGKRSNKKDGSADKNGDGNKNSDVNKNSNANKNSTNKNSSSKNKFGGILGRSRSIKVDESSSPREAPRSKLKANVPRRLAETNTTAYDGSGDTGNVRTAPLEGQRSWRQNINIGGMRTHSEDRHKGGHSEDARATNAGEQHLSSSYNEPRGGSFMTAIKTSSTKAADGFGKGARAVFDKLHRSGSSNEKDAPTTEYEIHVINRPLIEQTLMTRISKRLENSKDKTEFWMPALPWRCIDYLNMKGCEEEGLYRVPGSGREIKYWEQRFDKELDINLFDEPELYDINIIGSMFKNWLRNIPDEIFPKAIQARIQQECQGAKSTPQMLKDELSKLPPYHYYLLFAITCHISLLHSCSEQNKMDYRNLCICFQPCMKIEAFCFQFLVLDWRNCWQGCWTEKEYLAAELKALEKIEARSHPSYLDVEAQSQASSYGVQARSHPSSLDVEAQSQASSYGAQSQASSYGAQSQAQPQASSYGTQPQAQSRAHAPSFGARTTSLTGSTAAPSFEDRSGAMSSSASSKQSMTGMPDRRRGTPVAAKRSFDDDGSTPTQAGYTRLAAPHHDRLEIQPTSPFSLGFPK